MMKGRNRQAWVEAGYQLISEHGFTHVKVESIARALNRNKSSFYHYFGDWPGFEEALLVHHIQLARPFAEKIHACQSIIPDMVSIFLAHKTDIFFHKQLRINRENPQFKKCFEEVFELFEQAVQDKWISFLKLDRHAFLAKRFLALLSENFLLQITHTKYSEAWLTAYLLEHAKLMQDMNPPAKP